MFYKHEDGWDVFKKSDCYYIDQYKTWFPSWFDSYVIEDAPTKADAMKQLQGMHILGMCFVA